MEINLSDKLVIVTGGGRGIGREIVLTLAEEGATVVTTDINAADLDSLGAELDKRGASHREFVCDVTNSGQIGETITAINEEFGRIDVLVNNAGIVAKSSIAEMSEDTWDALHDVNLKGTFLMCQAVLPTMKKQRAGRIINAASFAAKVPIYGEAGYAASKIAVAHFTQALAGEVGPWNITANCYAPGMIPTEMNQFAAKSPVEQNQLLDTLSLRRWGDARDIAHLICYLASDFASYITGTLIDISGGKLATQVPRLAYEAAAMAGEYDFDMQISSVKEE
ncbi:MAG TPA: SDR family NAD(P)-dependent oxidoreductase [Actinomycetales bacterium]|nr:SDR family NAD(P)-dependent oxidoreductase [Actinomycetales bacterium]